MLKLSCQKSVPYCSTHHTKHVVLHVALPSVMSQTEEAEAGLKARLDASTTEYCDQEVTSKAHSLA